MQTEDHKITHLFHCLNKPPQGDALQVTCERDVNGRTGQFLFAATHLSKALAFSFSYHDEEVLCNGAIEDTDDEFIIICGGQKTLDKNRNITVLKFSAEGFEPIKGGRQCVSESAIKFSDTDTVLQATSIHELMQNGLQIFLLDEDLDQDKADTYFEFFEGKCPAEYLSFLMKNQNMRWINAECNIGINSVLEDNLSAYIDLNAPAHVQHS